MKKGTAPSGTKSIFNMEKYQFFLDADFEISNRCCAIMKKDPVHKYNKLTGRVPITAQMASESILRLQKWLQNGCNAFELKNPISNPMAFWTEQDILHYCVKYNIKLASVYGNIVPDTKNEIDGQMTVSDYIGVADDTPLKTTGCDRTGCILCGFGCHLEKKGEGRFLRLKEIHPNAYKALDVIENNGVTMREAIEWINEHGGFNIEL